jgi:hypothetical protein
MNNIDSLINWNPHIDYPGCLPGAGELILEAAARNHGDETGVPPICDTHLVQRILVMTKSEILEILDQTNEPTNKQNEPTN